MEQGTTLELGEMTPPMLIQMQSGKATLTLGSDEGILRPAAGERYDPSEPIPPDSDVLLSTGDRIYVPVGKVGALRAASDNAFSALAVVVAPKFQKPSD